MNQQETAYHQPQNRNNYKFSCKMENEYKSLFLEIHSPFIDYLKIALKDY